MVIVASIVRVVVGAVVVAACWAMSARILVGVHLGFLSIGVLVGDRDHLANPYGWLAVELGAKLTVMESLMKVVMTSASMMLGIEFLISEKQLM